MAHYVIDTNSCLCSKSELDITYVPATQVALERTRFEAHFPVTNTDLDSPLKFQITSGDSYLNLSKSYLYLKCSLERNKQQIVMPDSGKAEGKDVCFPINYLISTAN